MIEFSSHLLPDAMSVSTTIFSSFSPIFVHIPQSSICYSVTPLYLKLVDHDRMFKFLPIFAIFIFRENNLPNMSRAAFASFARNMGRAQFVRQAAMYVCCLFVIV